MDKEVYEVRLANWKQLILQCRNRPADMTQKDWLEDGAFSWPRTPEGAAQLTPEEYKQLMMGLNPLHPKIRDVHPDRVLL